MKKGKGVREGTGAEGERVGKKREKGWEERGPKARPRIRPFSRDSRESRDFRDSRDSSHEK